MAKLKFQAVMKIYDGNPYIHMSYERATKLKKGWKKPMPVKVQINGKPNPPWKINMMPIGDGSFYLYLHGEVRKDSNTKVGDKVTVTVTFDKDYKSGPIHPMPVWFKSAFAKNPTAKSNWEKLIPSRQKEILRYFSRLKSDLAKKRNLEKAMKALSGSSTRFMARSWEKGA